MEPDETVGTGGAESSMLAAWMGGGRGGHPPPCGSLQPVGSAAVGHERGSGYRIAARLRVDRHKTVDGSPRHRYCTHPQFT